MAESNPSAQNHPVTGDDHRVSEQAGLHDATSNGMYIHLEPL